MPKRKTNDKINDEEPEERGTFPRASEEVLKTRVMKKAVRRFKKGGGDTGFPKASTVEESPLPFLSKERTELGTRKRSGAASKFTFASTNTNTTYDVGASKGPFSGLKGFAKTTTAGKAPFSFFSETSNENGAIEKFTFRSPIRVAQKAEAEHGKSSNYITKRKQLNQSLTESLINNLIENSTCDLTSLFNQYVNYLKEMDKDEDKLQKLVSKGAEMVSQMLTPSFGFPFPANPFPTSTSGAADWTSSSCNTSTSSAATTTNLPLFTVGSFDTSALISADKPSFFGGTTKPIAKATEKNQFNFALKTDQTNTPSSNLEEESRYNHILFGDKFPTSDNNKESEKKPPALSCTPVSNFRAFRNTKPLALSAIRGQSGAKTTPCKTSTSLPKLRVGSFGNMALIPDHETRISMMYDKTDEEPEDRGTFQRATEEVLKTRVMRKAVRRNNKGTGPFSDLKGFAKTTTAGKYPFSFLSGTSNASDAKEEFTFRSPTSTAEKAEAELRQSLTELLITQIDEIPGSDLTPLFNHYVNYLKEMDKGEDKLQKLISKGAEKVSQMLTPSFGFPFPANPFPTSTSGAADWTSSSCNTSTSSATTTTNLPLFIVGSFDTSALISADKPSFFGGTTKSIAKATEKNDFNFALKTDQTNTPSSNLEEKSRYNHILFGDKFPSSDNNKESEKKPPALSFTPGSNFRAFRNTKPLALSAIRGQSGAKTTPCKTSTSLPKLRVGSFGNIALIPDHETRISMMYDETDEEPEDRGTFQRASEEVLKTRVMRKAVRRSNKGTGPFSDLKGFAKTTTAGKYPFSFLSGTSNAGDAKEEFTFRSPTSTAEKAEAKLRQSLTELIITQIGENATRDLTPLFNNYVKYLKEMDKGEDKLGKLVSNAAQKVSLMVAPFSEITFPAKHFSTPISTATITTSSQTSTSTTIAADNTILPELTVGSSGTFSLISADKATLLEGATTSSSKATQTIASSFDLKPVETNRNTKPSSRTPESCFFGVKVEEKSSFTSPIFGGHIPSSVNNKKSEEKSPDLSFTSVSAPFTLMDVKSPALTESPEKSDDDGKEFNQELLKFSLHQIKNANSKINNFLKNNAIYPKMCKIFIKTVGKYTDHGVGTLYLKALKVAGSTKLSLRAVTDQGNELVNFVLRKDILMQRVGKHNVLVVAVSFPTTPILLRFKTSKDADEVLETLQKYKQ